MQPSSTVQVHHFVITHYKYVQTTMLSTGWRWRRRRHSRNETNMSSWTPKAMSTELKY